MRLITTIVSLCALGYGYFWISEKNPKIKNFAPLIKNQILEILNSGSSTTLEARFSASQLMDMHKKFLLKDSKHKFLEPSLKFYPYLLMEVKYSQSADKTGEGIILWDLIDGEMVINTKNWEKSHGFGDCIKAIADRHEYKILQIISQKGGAISRDTLLHLLQVENEILDTWIESCRKKKLIVQNGSTLRLHLKNPRLIATPETTIDHHLVTKSFKNAERLPRRYTTSQIKRAAELAFGNDFAIRTIIDVYLPIYSITVQNPDGSIYTTYWNAVTGQRIQGTLSF